MMRMQRVAGLIVIPTRSDAEHGNSLVNQIHVPTVLLDMYVEGLPYPVIKTDNVEAGRIAADHLLALGHRSIGIIVGIRGLATSDDRYAGYLRAFADHGAPVDPALAVAGNFDQQEAEEAATELLTRPNRPTAMIAISNMMTVGLLFAIKNLQLNIPDDVSVVGIDDLEFARIVSPPPTVVVTPILEMARRSIELLLTQIGNKPVAAAQWEIYTPKLLIRKSTRPLPRG